MRKRGAITVLAAAAVLGAGGWFATVDTASASEGYRLSSGDALRITIFNEPKLSGEFTLDDGGVLSFPLIGNVSAGGLTADQLESALDQRLRGDYLVNPRIAVDVVSYKPFSILGEVKHPGRLPYSANLNVLDAVAMAGGFTLRANKRDIEITRGGKDRRTIDADQETMILPGDIVRVKQRFF